MLSDDFLSWAADLAAATGFPLEGCVQWAGVLAAEGCHAAELHDAADWLLAREPPPFRLEFFRALTSRLRSRRAEKRSAEGPRLDLPACPDCHGSGWAVVPDTRRGREGQEVALSCSCPAGRALVQGLADHFRAKGKTLLSLAEYEAERPTWRQERDRLAAVAKARRAAEADAAGLDGALGPVLRRIMGRLKTKGTSDRGG